MIIDNKKMHGMIVLAKMSNKSQLWAAVIIYNGEMDVACFKETKGKTIVWWLSHNTYAQIKNEYIYEFNLEIKNCLTNVTGERKDGLIMAIEVLCFQLEVKFPISCNTENTIIWALKNLPNMLKKRKSEGKLEVFHIPYFILNSMKLTNDVIRHATEKKKQKKCKKIQNISDSSQNQKKNGNHCMACKVVTDEPKINHPIFKGFLCNNCFTKGKDHILAISKDKSNDACCICFNYMDKLVLCSFCIRVYCEKCLIFYCGETGLTEILEVLPWNCLACSTTPKPTSCRLITRSLNQQLKNIYSLYPATDSIKNYPRKKQFDELYVMSLKDIKNIVPHILNTFKCPYKLIMKDELHDTVMINTHNIVKLILKCYPSYEISNNDNPFDTSGCLESFFSFFRILNEFKALNNYNGHLFWAFETSASINFEAKKTISRFCEQQPIIIGLNEPDVLKRSRFIWTNITVYNKNIMQYTKQNIFLYTIPTNVERRNHYDKDNSGCNGSIDLILSSFLQNDIVF